MQPNVDARMPVTMSGGRSRSDSASDTTPAAISTAAAIAAWRAGRGLGGRPESASITGTREAVRPGHHAAPAAPTTARSAAATTSPHGMLSRSMR